MNRTSFPIAVVLLFVLLFAASSSAQEAVSQSAPDRVIYPIFGWLPLYGVDLKLPDGPPCTGCPPDPVVASASSSGLSGGWFAGLRLEFGRFAVAGDFNWAGLSAERERPLLHAKADVFLGGILGGVRVYGPWFLEAGARYSGLNAKFNVLSYPEIEWKPGRWSPAVGTTFRPRLGRHVLLYTHVDYSGLGVHDVSAVNGSARIEWRPVRHLSVTGGYGFLTVTLDGSILDSTRFSRSVHFKQTLHGPIVGIGIPF